MCRDKKKWAEFADGFDEFSQQAPSFSIRGRDEVHSYTGLCATFIMYIALFSYSLYSTKRMLWHENPTIMEIK
jgi:hypothetical protein